jgi:hypothetical protein
VSSALATRRSCRRSSRRRSTERRRDAVEVEKWFPAVMGKSPAPARRRRRGAVESRPLRDAVEATPARQTAEEAARYAAPARGGAGGRRQAAA